MKIKGTCAYCGREFLAEQIIESGGRCPWDGRSLQPDYAVVLVDALREAEASGNTLENALEKIADVEPMMALDPASVLTTIREHLERLERAYERRA